MIRVRKMSCRVYASSTSELQLSHLSLVHSEFPTEITIEAMIVHCYKAVLPCGSESYRLATRPRGSTRILSLERDFLMTSAEKSRVHCKIVLPGGALKFPAAVSSWISTVLSHPSYFSVQAALNDLFQLPGYTWCTFLAQLLDRFFGPKCVSKALEQVSDNQPGNNPYIIAMVVIDLL